MADYCAQTVTAFNRLAQLARQFIDCIALLQQCQGVPDRGGRGDQLAKVRLVQVNVVAGCEIFWDCRHEILYIRNRFPRP